MPRWIWDRQAQELVEVGPRAAAPSSGPVVRSDIGGYQSPVDGRWIEGNAARRDDLKRHGCIDARERFGGDGGHPRFKEARERARYEQRRA